MMKSLVVATIMLAVNANFVLADDLDYEALRARLERLEQDNIELRKEVTELRGNQNNNWLNQRRAEEVKALVQEVLSDADTRASLMAQTVTSGHENGIFFLASPDGKFLMQIGGLIQTRYTWNHRETAPAGNDQQDDDESGFVLPRVRLEVSGYLGDPRFTYFVRFGPDREDNEVLGEKAVVGYQVAERVGLFVGEDKAPFLREELTAAGQQLAVDRSLVNEVFTAGYIQGVWVQWVPTDSFTVAASINDGVRSGEADNESNSAFIVAPPGDPDLGPIHKPFFLDRTDFAITVRADLKVMGEWSQYNDFSAWSGEDTAVFVGGAIHYQVGETGSTAENNNFVLWTIDGSIESNGANIFASFTGLHTDLGAAGPNNLDMYGLVIQGGYMVIPDKLEPFVRFEWIDLDGRAGGGSDNDIFIVTIGANYYLVRHRAKFVVDVMWAGSDMPDSSVLGLQDNDGFDQSLGAIGLRQDLDDDQFVLRLQFQLMF